jgi:lysophospholipase L1-like esterase
LNASGSRSRESANGYPARLALGAVPGQISFVNTPALPRRLLAGLSLSAGLLALHASLVRAADAPAPAAAPAPTTPPISLVPAAVPPQVAIARPSPAEVEQASTALKRFLQQADAGTKALVAKYPELVSVRPPRANPSLTPNLSNQHRQKHANNLARIQEGPIDLLFMGDSITDSWRSTGKEVFDKYYGQYKTGNFGIGGDTIQGVLYRLRDGEGTGFTPKAIMLMIGTNNSSPIPTAGMSSAEIAEGVGAIVLDMRTRWPAAKILLLGIFPRSGPGDHNRNIVLGANPIIAKLHDGKNVFYMDIGEKFLAPDGTIPNDIMPDRLHPNLKGYGIWAEAVKDKVAELMK